jgi:hypothetical protein
MRSVTLNSEPKGSGDASLQKAGGCAPHRTIPGISRGDSTGHPEAATPAIPVLAYLLS